VTRGDGDGWSRGPGRDRRWGRFGAAGLLLRAPGEGGPVVLLQHRAFWSHHGGTWGLPGGARDSHESTEQTALREAAEEAGVRAADVEVRAERLTSQVTHGWSYTTVVADARHQLRTQRDRESAELRWVAEREVAALPLHPGFAASWSMLRARPMRLVLDDAAGLAPSTAARAAFPRTLELPSGEFAWVGPPGPAADIATLPYDREGYIVVTANRELRARLHPRVSSIDPAALLS